MAVKPKGKSRARNHDVSRSDYLKDPKKYGRMATRNCTVTVKHSDGKIILILGGRFG